MNRQQRENTTMPDVDEEGFLVETEGWTKDVAQILAKKLVPEKLTEDHWRVINFMRQYYLEYGSIPPTRMLARNTGTSLQRIKELFPTGLTHGCCKIAGIPRIAIRPNFLYP